MKAYVVTLGCDKNRVDTENILGFMVEGGHQIVFETNDAEIFLINTCAFITDAVKESLDVIFEFSQYKKPIIVCGCLPMRFLEQVTDDGVLDEVNAFVGNEYYDKINFVISEVMSGKRINLINKNQYCFPSSKRIITTPFHYAYLKIAEGCNNHCLYCTIPSIRGKYVSQKPELVLSEAKELVDSGVKELILVAQDTTKYGTDLFGKPHLVELLDKLCTLDVRWLRLLYCYPELVSDQLINYIADNSKVASYIDIPLQHVSNDVLKRMGRKGNEALITTLMDKLLAKKISVRSTFMVGYPKESELDFLKLCDFITQYPFENAGFFSYSNEEGSASYKLDGQIPQKEKKTRLKHIESIQSQLMLERQKKKIGQTVKVVYDGIDYRKNLFFGHSEANCPYVDKKVYFSSKNAVAIGDTYTVRITATSRLDLKGEVTNEFTD